MPTDRSAPDCSRRRLLHAGAAAAAATGLSGCIISMRPYTATEERTFDPGDADSVAVETQSGDVTLSGGSGDAVAGTVRKESRSGRDALDRITVESTVRDGRLVIESTLPDDADVSVDLDLSLPDALALERAASTNGDVSVSDVAGDPRCETHNGDVSVDGVDGYVTGVSGNGDVSVGGVGGLDGARTTNGDVTVDVPAVRRDVTVSSTNGDVTAAVPTDLSVGVELSTSNGEVEAAVDLSSNERSETFISGRLGSGDPEHRLALRTTNGDVTLESLS